MKRALAGRKGVHVKGNDEAEVALEDGDPPAGELKEEDHPRAIDQTNIAVPEHSHPE